MSLIRKHLALPDFICRQWFAGVVAVLLDVKSRVEHNGKCYKSRKCPVFEIIMLVLHIRTSRPSLLMESTDSPYYLCLDALLYYYPHFLYFTAL